MILKHSEHV